MFPSGMSNETVLSDEYVAELMALEAQDCSVKYSTMGLEAFRSSKPKNLAKPNTRFLRQIIRETTNHNAALLAKEAQESQARLDDLTSANEAKQRRLNPGAGDIRRRQLGDISAILSGRKRNRTVESPVADERGAGDSAAVGGSSTSSDSATRKQPEPRHSRSSSGRLADDGFRHGAADRSREKGRLDRHHRDPERHGKGERHVREGNRHGRRSQSPRDAKRGHRYASVSSEASTDVPGTRRSQSRRSRSRQRDRRGMDRGGFEDLEPRASPGSKAGRSGRSTAENDSLALPPRKKRDLFQEMTAGRFPTSPPHRNRDCLKTVSSSRRRNDIGTRPCKDSGTSDTGHEDDDPLDHFIGPFPAVQPTVRGRGRISTASAMDKRFSDSYDPRSDTQPDDDYSEGIGSGGGSKDWDESAEAYRDRQKWKQQGAARLRVAGFTEEQIKKWEKGGPSGEKDLDDVRWRKAGEDREWDRGKVVGVDGTTTLALGWPARLD